MSEPLRAAAFPAWSRCTGCGFEGLVEHRCREDENYSREDALAVMMDSICPACGQHEPVLVVMDEYREMLFLAGRAARGSPSGG